MKRHQDNNNFEFVGHEKNDGYHSFEGQLVVTKEVLDTLGINTVLKMRRRIFQVLGYKELIYGEEYLNNEETIALPREVYFKNKVTGAVVSFTHTALEEVLNSKTDLIYIARRYDGKLGLNYDPDYAEDIIEPPVFLKELLPDKGGNIPSSEQPIVVSFRPDLGSKI